MLGRVACGLLVALLLLAALLYGAFTTERGTRYAWDTVRALSGGHLSGQLDGGTLATGVSLRDVAWRASNGTAITINQLSGQWAWRFGPRHLNVDYLHVGDVEVWLAPHASPSPSPMTLPRELRLPFALDVRDLRVASLRLHEGLSDATYAHLVFHAHSDGRQHDATLERLDTPYGAVSAHVTLDGERPFAVSGNLLYTGKVSGEDVQVNGSLGGSLENMVVQLDASGMKLTGHAHVEATPFASVPLRRATLAFDHVNPQAFAPGAPFADLALRAQLQPDSANEAAVTGDFSIVNAKPGALNAHLLPFADAHADVALDATTQRISNLAVHLAKGATISGGGTVRNRHGEFDLAVAALDLNALQSSLRATHLSGPIVIQLNDDTQRVNLDLADAAAALRVQGSARFDAKQMNLEEVRVSAGNGRADLSGALQRDAHSTYALKATLVDFDPLLFTSRTPSTSLMSHAAGKGKGKGSREGSSTRRGATNVNGTFSASGALAPDFSTKVDFRLGPSLYEGMPLTGSGAVQLAGTRLMPSHANLSAAGNAVDLQGSFGAPGDRLRFRIDAPQLARLGFGLAGQIAANGDLTGSFAHPDVSLNYRADGVAFGANRIGHAEGSAQLHDGANGALAFMAEARDLKVGDVALATLSAHLSGTRAQHTFVARAAGKVAGQPLDLSMAANGRLTDAGDGTRWDGAITQLQNHGALEASLLAPLAVHAAAGRLTLGAAQMTLEGATLALHSFDFDHGRIRSAGTLTHASLARMLALRAKLTGTPSALKTDLVFDGDWDFMLGQSASGYVQLKRRSGDVTLDLTRGQATLGLTDFAARAAFGSDNRMTTTVHAQASRVGALDINASATLLAHEGHLEIADESPLGGTVKVSIPSLAATGGLFGPGYLLQGQLALQLALGGTVAKPDLSGSLTGDNLSATLVDQGIQLKNGVLRVALSHNLVDLQQVEFHGARGALRATGRVRLDGDDPNMTANIVADKLELFASPERKLSVSGSASVASGGAAGGMTINGHFTVDHALFDMPGESAPRLGDDVVIVQPDGTLRGGRLSAASTSASTPEAGSLAGRFAPHANISIDLGQDFRFRGHGADLGLAGTITMTSAPAQPLRAVGDVHMTPGSTYTAFGRKLAIENGFFTFNGPVSNPGINILAMRRSQQEQVEAGVQVTGTLASPVAKLVSEPNVPDNEKLSWLLFGHGTDQGNNLGQQSAMSAALALLGSAGGKRVAQAIGLDDFSIGRSEVGLTDPQVVMLSKALNERLVVGYEQGLQSAANAVKVTVSLTRYWSVTVYGGTFDGIDLLYTRRFDRLFGKAGDKQVVRRIRDVHEPAVRVAPRDGQPVQHAVHAHL